MSAEYWLAIEIREYTHRKINYYVRNKIMKNHLPSWSEEACRRVRKYQASVCSNGEVRAGSHHAAVWIQKILSKMRRRATPTMREVTSATSIETKMLINIASRISWICLECAEWKLFISYALRARYAMILDEGAICCRADDNEDRQLRNSKAIIQILIKLSWNRNGSVAYLGAPADYRKQSHHATVK